MPVARALRDALLGQRDGAWMLSYLQWLGSYEHTLVRGAFQFPRVLLFLYCDAAVSGAGACR